MTSSNSELASAGIGRRLAAMVYDGFLVFALLFVASLIPALLLNMDQLGASPETNTVVHELNSPLQGWLYRIYLLTVTAAFFAIFWRKSGQTLGMQAWRLKLIRVDGSAPSWRQCLIRLAVATISLAAAGLGYWWIWIDREKRSWHDMASGTKVIVLPKTK